jgi:hypothetical protein
METMDIYALVWRMNLYTPCFDKETMTRFTLLTTYIIREVENHFTKDQAAKIILDMSTSAVWHKGYYRKDGRTPYIFHPFEIVELLFILGLFDYKLTAAAIYHDNVEDEKDKDKRYRKRQFITKNSGPAVRDIVELVTKSKRLHEKVLFFRRLREEKRAALATRACILKLADCAKNTETFDVFIGDHLKRKVAEVRKEYPSLAKKAHQSIKKLSAAQPKKKFLHRITEKLFEKIMHNISTYE